MNNIYICGIIPFIYILYEERETRYGIKNRETDRIL